ncbi:MAG: hypothetical protein WA020_16460, partial [Candidatus Acidiferrales bacterium]
FRHVEAGGKHRSNCLASVDGAVSHLMVSRLGMVKGSQGINVCTIEGLDPSLYNVTWSHCVI